MDISGWNRPLRFACRVMGLSVLLLGPPRDYGDYGISGFRGLEWFVAGCFIFS